MNFIEIVRKINQQYFEIFTKISKANPLVNFMVEKKILSDFEKIYRLW